MAKPKIFLSAVTGQFKECREALRSDLSAAGAEVLVQEDFTQGAGTLLEKLEAYIASCDRVIVLVGDAYGLEPEPSARPQGFPVRSYTQWEYYFARGERLDRKQVTAKPVFVYFATSVYLEKYSIKQSIADTEKQQKYIREIHASGIDWGKFNSIDGLARLVLRDGFKLAGLKKHEIESQEKERYLNFVAEQSRYLDTTEVDRVNAQLVDTFVMLDAIESPNRGIKDDIAPGDERKKDISLPIDEQKSYPSPMPLSKTLPKHTHLVILGEPGSGKTTTLQYIALCFATPGWVKQKLALDENKIPIRVSLKKYNGKKGLGLFITDLLVKQNEIPEQVAQEWLGKGKLILLLDGLDEVSGLRREATAQAIQNFSFTEVGRRCRIVVTTRIAGYRSISGLGINFGHYTIRPFTGPDDALHYVSSWLKALRPRGYKRVDEEAKSLLQQMENKDSLRRVLGNPLLLRLVVAVFVEGKKDLLSSRADLYRRYVEEVSWKKVETRSAHKWKYFQSEAALKIVAWTLANQDEERELSLARKLETLVPNIENGRLTLTFLREQLGLLATYGYEGGDLIAFRHLTFQEYFVALTIQAGWANDWEKCWSFLRPRLHHPTWREPILLLTGMLKLRERERFILSILKANSSHEEVMHRDLLLASTALAEGEVTDHRIKKDVSSRLSAILIGLNDRLKETAIKCAAYLPESIKENIVNILVDELEGEDSSVQEFAVRSLGKLGDSRAVEPLIELLKDKNSTIRFYVAEALGRLGDKRAVEPLIEAHKDKDSDIQISSATALSRLGDCRAVKLLTVMLKDDELASYAASALDELGDSQAVEPLIEILNDEDSSVQGFAVKLLSKLGDCRAVEPLIELLKDKNFSIRESAAEALGRLGDSRAVEPLIELLKDKNFIIRKSAAKALGKIGGREVMVLLIEFLNNDDLASSVAMGLAELGDSRAVEPIIKLLKGKDASIQESAIKQLAQLCDSRTIEPLIETLNDAKLAESAVRALGKLGDSRAVEPIIDLLNEALNEALNDSPGDDGLAESAVWALGELGDKRALKPLIRALNYEYDPVECSAVEALGKLGDSRAVEPLIELLRNEDYDFRHYGVPEFGYDARYDAIISLGKIGDNHAVLPLIEALKDNDKGEMFFSYTAYALVQLGDSRAVEPLIEALKDAKFTESAVRALGELGDSRAVEPLIKMLEKKPYYYVHKAIELVLLKITEQEVKRLPCEHLWFINFERIKSL